MQAVAAAAAAAAIVLPPPVQANPPPPPPPSRSPHGLAPGTSGGGAYASHQGKGFFPHASAGPAGGSGVRGIGSGDDYPPTNTTPGRAHGGVAGGAGSGRISYSSSSSSGASASAHRQALPRNDSYAAVPDKVDRSFPQESEPPGVAARTLQHSRLVGGVGGPGGGNASAPPTGYAAEPLPPTALASHPYGSQPPTSAPPHAHPLHPPLALRPAASGVGSSPRGGSAARQSSPVAYTLPRAQGPPLPPRPASSPGGDGGTERGAAAPRLAGRGPDVGAITPLTPVGADAAAACRWHPAAASDGPPPNGGSQRLAQTFSLGPQAGPTPEVTPWAASPRGGNEEHRVGVGRVPNQWDAHGYRGPPQPPPLPASAATAEREAAARAAAAVAAGLADPPTKEEGLSGPSPPLGGAAAGTPSAPFVESRLQPDSGAPVLPTSSTGPRHGSDVNSEYALPSPRHPRPSPRNPHAPPRGTLYQPHSPGGRREGPHPSISSALPVSSHAQRGFPPMSGYNPSGQPQPWVQPAPVIAPMRGRPRTRAMQQPPQTSQLPPRVGPTADSDAAGLTGSQRWRADGQASGGPSFETGRAGPPHRGEVTRASVHLPDAPLQQQSQETWLGRAGRPLPLATPPPNASVRTTGRPSGLSATAGPPLPLSSQPGPSPHPLQSSPARTAGATGGSRATAAAGAASPDSRASTRSPRGSLAPGSHSAVVRADGGGSVSRGVDGGEHGRSRRQHSEEVGSSSPHIAVTSPRLPAGQALSSQQLLQPSSVPPSLTKNGVILTEHPPHPITASTTTPTAATAGPLYGGNPARPPSVHGAWGGGSAPEAAERRHRQSAPSPRPGSLGGCPSPWAEGEAENGPGVRSALPARPGGGGASPVDRSDVAAFGTSSRGGVAPFGASPRGGGGAGTPRATAYAAAVGAATGAEEGGGRYAAGLPPPSPRPPSLPRGGTGEMLGRISGLTVLAPLGPRHRGGGGSSGAGIGSGGGEQHGPYPSLSPGRLGRRGHPLPPLTPRSPAPKASAVAAAAAAAAAVAAADAAAAEAEAAIRRAAAAGADMSGAVPRPRRPRSVSPGPVDAPSAKRRHTNESVVPAVTTEAGAGSMHQAGGSEQLRAPREPRAPPALFPPHSSSRAASAPTLGTRRGGPPISHIAVGPSILAAPPPAACSPGTAAAGRRPPPSPTVYAATGLLDLAASPRVPSSHSGDEGGIPDGDMAGRPTGPLLSSGRRSATGTMPPSQSPPADEPSPSRPLLKKAPLTTAGSDGGGGPSTAPSRYKRAHLKVLIPPTVVAGGRTRASVASTSTGPAGQISGGNAGAGGGPNGSSRVGGSGGSCSPDVRGWSGRDNRTPTSVIGSSAPGTATGLGGTPVGDGNNGGLSGGGRHAAYGGAGGSGGNTPLSGGVFGSSLPSPYPPLPPYADKRLPTPRPLTAGTPPYAPTTPFGGGGPPSARGPGGAAIFTGEGGGALTPLHVHTPTMEADPMATPRVARAPGGGGGGGMPSLPPLTGGRGGGEGGGGFGAPPLLTHRRLGEERGGGRGGPDVRRGRPGAAGRGRGGEGGGY